MIAGKGLPIMFRIFLLGKSSPASKGNSKEEANIPVLTGL